MRRAEWEEGRGLTFPGSPSAPHAFAVSYEVRYDDLTTGRDTASIAFVDGWLAVDGRQASFALRPCDVSVRGDGSMTLAGGGWLRFGDEDRPLELLAALGDWCREASPEGEPVFPPARVHPSRVAVALAPGALSVPLFLLAGFVAGTSWVGNVAAVGLMAFGFSALYAAGSTIADLRRRDHSVASARQALVPQGERR